MIAVLNGSPASTRWLAAAWKVAIGCVAAVGAFQSGAFVLFWLMPWLIVSSITWAISYSIPPAGRADYSRLALVADAPLAVALLGGTLGALLDPQVAFDALATVVCGSIVIAFASGVVFSAIQTRRSAWKAGGPIGLTLIAVNTFVAFLMFACVPTSLTRFSGF